MRGQRIITRALGVIFIAATCLAATPVEAEDDRVLEPAAETTSKVELFQIPKTEWPGFSDMVIDSSGIPWIMADNKVFYLDGTEFREPVSGPMSSGYYLADLYGGPDRGAYATQKGKKEHEGLLYRLNDGASELLTTFYYDVSHKPPGLYVSKNGRLFNWGNRFLAVHDGEKWVRIEARLGHYLSGIFDLGEEVYFYYDNSLYCATGSAKLQPRECPKWIKARPGQNRIVGALWAGRRALLVNYGKPGLFAFDLATGEEIDLAVAVTGHQDTRFYDAFSVKSGDVWILGRCERASTYSFFVLSADGQLSEIPATRALLWRNTRCSQYPHSVLETPDGALIFGQPQDGIAVLRDGKLTQWGWRYGLAEGIRHLHQHQDGSIWFPINGQVAKLRLGDGPPATHPSAVDWQEFALTSGSQIWELKPGQLAMFRDTQRGRLSRWDGKNWTQQEVPFDTTKTGRSATDDRGHLLIAQVAHPDGFFDVGLHSIERFDNMEALLASAVAAGAGEFRSGNGFQGIVVTPEERIWFGYHNYNSVKHYDGVRWDSLGFSDNVLYLFHSLRHGILARTQGGRFYRYEQGQMVEVEPPLRQTRALMIGEKHLQPYERALVDSSPGKYFPVIRDGGKMTLFIDPEEFDASIEDEGIRKLAACVELPQNTERFSEAASGGAWVFVSVGTGSPFRLFGGGLYQIDVAGTPLAGKRILDIKEDALGGLWFLTRFGASGLAYYHRQSQIQLKVDAAPEECGRELTVKVSILPEQMADSVQLLSRVNNGMWSPTAERDGRCLYRFPVSGDYHCEITGLMMGGRLRSGVSFRVRASVQLPDTVLTDGERKVFVVDTLEWRAPVSIEKTNEANAATLLWRTVGGIWQPMAEGTTLVPMSGLGAGEYTLELCAEEDGIWRDPSPVSVKIQFAPDYQKIVSTYLRELSSEDAERRATARNRLLDLGEKGIPILEQRLQDAEMSARLVGPLREVLWELREQNQ